jgi:hypothetical protein
MDSDLWLIVPLFLSAAFLTYLLWPRRPPSFPHRRITSHRNGQSRHWGE